MFLGPNSNNAMNNILETIKNRSEFIKRLEFDIAKNNKIIDETKTAIEKLKVTKESIESLSTYPEQTALIPLGKNIYMNGVIKHTGECYMKRPAYPNSYLTLQTTNKTAETLANMIKSHCDTLSVSQYAVYQLEERISVLKGDHQIDGSLPEEIKSDKGVALRVGEYYEIFEFEE